MPYQPQTEYRGDQYLYNAISGLGQTLGQGISDTLQKTQELKRKGALNDTIIQHALDNKLISGDEFNRYLAGNQTTRDGIANGIMANIHDDFQQRQEARRLGMEQERLAVEQGHLGIAQQQANLQRQQAGWQPSAQDIQNAYSTNQNYVKVGGKWTLQSFPDKAGTGGNFMPEQLQVPPPPGVKGGHPITVYRRSPQQVEMVPPGPREVPTDPTGMYYFDAKGNPKQVSKAVLQQIELNKLPDNSLKNTPAPQSSFSLLHPTTWGNAAAADAAGTPPPALSAAPIAMPAPAVAASPASVAPAGDKFIPGKKYRDGQGNVATYLGQGHWSELPPE